MGEPLEIVKPAFNELAKRGYLSVDRDLGLVVIPWLVRASIPHGVAVNTVLGWRNIAAELPCCQLKRDLGLLLGDVMKKARPKPVKNRKQMAKKEEELKEAKRVFFDDVQHAFSK